MRYLLLSISLSLSLSFPLLGGSKSLSIGFYNTENLYDTIPSLFYDDVDYTPSGRMEWSSERYGAKLNNISRVIDEMELDILALSEVENRGVVRDLVSGLQTDYNYICETSGDGRGMDLALLYKGDKFIPERWYLVSGDSSREFLYVRGLLLGSRIDIIVCHLPSMLNSVSVRRSAMSSLYDFADSLSRNDLDSRPIVVGDFNATPSDRLMRSIFHTNQRGLNPHLPLFSPFEQMARDGLGTYSYNNRWQLIDNIFLSTRFLGDGSIRYLSSHIFIRPYLLDSDLAGRYGYPLRTFLRGVYRSGFSDHLPVYALFTHL